ncbi:MAG: hypothetical protein J0H65_16255 [Rhizobiales bacterium]|nr:hypothetical protein [Hyphomicrobiales bacterium]
MRWYISYPILAAGLAFGFETVFPSQPGVSPPADATAYAAPETRTAPVVLMASEMRDEPASRVGAFSPGGRLLTAEIPRASSSGVLDYLARALTPAEPVPPAPQRVTLAEWKSAIIRAPQTASVPQPAAPLSRDALTRDIQRELQRVGCYLGEIDGVWGGGSKRAVLMFMDRVNAALPTRDPDVFMLSLVKAQTSAVCGASCPRGQSLTASGRCLPSTLMAQADEAGDASVPDADAWTPALAQNTEQSGSRPAPPYGRMSIGGPKPDDVAELSTGWSRVSSTTTSSPGLARTAALEVTGDGEDAGLARAPQRSVAASSFDTDAVAEPVTVKRSKSSAARAKPRERPRRTSSYRQVQHLFQHPLGRM